MQLLLAFAREEHQDCVKGWLGYYANGKPVGVMRSTRYQAMQRFTQQSRPTEPSQLEVVLRCLFRLSPDIIQAASTFNSEKALR